MANNVWRNPVLRLARSNKEITMTGKQISQRHKKGRRQAPKALCMPDHCQISFVITRAAGRNDQVVVSQGQEVGTIYAETSRLSQSAFKDLWFQIVELTLNKFQDEGTLKAWRSTQSGSLAEI